MRALLLAGLLAAPARAATLHENMQVLQDQMTPLVEQAKGGRFAPDAAARAAKLEAVFAELAAAQNDYSKDPKWGEWVAQSASAARRLTEAVAAQDAAAAAAELQTLAVLREKAHEHFRPGLLGRLERWLAKRRIRQHETSAPAAPVLPRPIVPVRPVGAGAP